MTMHERVSAFDDLGSHPRPAPLSAVLNAHGLPPLQRSGPPTVPPPAGPPTTRPREVRSTAYTMHVVGSWVADLVLQHGLVDPDTVSCYEDRAHVWFRDPVGLGTFLAWFEQLDADSAPYLAVDEAAGDEQQSPIRGHGAIRGIPAYLYVHTPARLPAGYPTYGQLQQYVETDRRLRAQRPDGWWDR